MIEFARPPAVWKKEFLTTLFTDFDIKSMYTNASTDGRNKEFYVFLSAMDCSCFGGVSPCRRVRRFQLQQHPQCRFRQDRKRALRGIAVLHRDPRLQPRRPL